MQKILANVILLQVDCEKGEGVELAKKYNIRGYPTFYLINDKQEPLFVFMGYQKQYWSNKMEQALADLDPLSIKKEKFKAHPTFSLARVLADYAFAMNDLKSAYAYLKKAKNLSPSKTTDLDKEIFQVLYSGLRDSTFTLDTLKTFTTQLLQKVENEKTQARILLTMASLLSAYPDDELLISFLQKLVTLIKEKPDIIQSRARQQVEILNCLFIEKDVKKAVVKKKETMPEGWQENPDQLNSFAWWCFKNKINLDEAEQLARKAVKLAKNAKDRADILDTLAEILSLKGKHQEAIVMEQRAIALKPEKKVFQKNLQRFKERIKK